MNTITQALVGTIAAGAMAVSAASPAFARGQEGSGIDAGDVIAGALVIGGAAALLAAVDKDRDDDRRSERDYRDDRAAYGQARYDGTRYDGTRYAPDYRGPAGGYGYSAGYRGDRDGWQRVSPRRAIEQCVGAVEQGAGRYTRGRADVIDIRNLRETQNGGLMVYGRIAVQTGHRDWRHGDGDYGRGWNSDYRGWNAGMRGYDAGTFSCRFERGQVTHLGYYGIDSLR